MSIELITLLYFLCLFLGLFLGLPVALGLGGTAVLFAAIFEPRSLLAIPSAFYYTPWNGVLVTVPLFLFMGSLILESFFGIPGLGSYTIDAIQSQDFAVVRSMVFLGSVLYILGLIMTDISYTLVDPRIRLGAESR